MAVPRVFVVVGDEVQLALPDAGQGAVGAAQQERAHVRPGQATAMFNYLLFCCLEHIIWGKGGTEGSWLSLFLRTTCFSM